MKKVLFILSIFLFCASLAGCGEKEDDVQQGGVAQYTDVQADSETIFDGSKVHVVGIQFYQGEAVQIYTIPDENGSGLVDIYLYKVDGSKTMLLEGMSSDYSIGNWFLDTEGNLYYWPNDGEGIVKLDASGNILYTTQPLKDIGAVGLVDICQVADGRVLITYLEGSVNSYYTLSEIDPVTGEISKVRTVKLDGLGHVAPGEEGLLYMDAKGIYEIDLEDGSKTSILSFIGTSYLLQDTRYIKDFRVLADGNVEILRYERDSATGNVTYTSEVLQAATEATEKTVLTMRCYGFSEQAHGVSAWLKNQMALFNGQSDSFMVVLDESQEGVEREDFARQTSIEIAAGKGPDLIYGDVLGEYAYGAIQKGALVDLAPYMEASGIKEEDYFPAAFDCWKENGGIYGVSLSVSLASYRIRQEVVGVYSVPDMETLVDALLAWQEDAILISDFNYDSLDVLEYLLQGSENIWGTIDWEAGTCDFSGEFFAKILEVAKRYGYDERNNYPGVMEYRQSSLLAFDTAADREAEGMAEADVMFDDGRHALINNSLPGVKNEMLAVNANSAHIEGAWEFIGFLLGEEAQTAFQSDSSGGISYDIPVNRKAFEVCTERRIAKWINSKSEEYGYVCFSANGGLLRKYPRSYEDLTEEKLEEYREFLDSARPIPLRTASLLDIIYEEAEYYFNGTKSIGEVTAVIQNCVQLYLDENN